VGKLLIMIDENYVDIEKKKESERIKSMATADTEWLQFKGKDSEQVDYFGKIFMTANNKEFIKIDKEEIRYMVVEVPAYEKNDPDLLEKMIGEIPAFLYTLTERKVLHPREDRAWFRPELLESDTLREVVQNTKHKHEDMIDEFIDECMETFKGDFRPADEMVLHMTVNDILMQLQPTYKFLDSVKIRRHLKALGHNPLKVQQYTFYSLTDKQSNNIINPNYKSTRIGRPYEFKRKLSALDDDNS
jgi:hypothetical protein